MRSRILAFGFGGLVGIGLSWVAVTLLGLLVVVPSEYRFWGQSVYLIMFVEFALAFLPLSVAVGTLLTMLHRENTWSANAGGAVGALVLLLSDVNWLDFSLREATTTAAYFFLLPGLFIVGGIVLGAVFAKRPSNEAARA